MTAPVRIGLLGLGQRGLQHLNSLTQLRDEGLVEIVALMDAFPQNLDPDKLRSHVKGLEPNAVHLSSDFRATLDAVPMDAVWFAIPPAVHNGEVVAAAEKGLHLFVEKPVSLYLDEALAMRRAIDQAGVIAAVGFQQRHSPQNDAVRTFLADKKPLMITVVSNSPLESHNVKHTHTETLGGPKNRVWTANLEWSGSTVVEAGIHQTDLMRYWLGSAPDSDKGDIEWVEANYLHRDPDDIEDGGDNPYAYRVAYGFKNGAVANLLFSRLRKVFYSDGYNSLLWTHGHLKFEGREIAAYYYDGEYPPKDRPTMEQLRHVLPTTPQQDDMTTALDRAFVNAVASRDTSGLRNDFASSLNSHAAVLGANVSDKLGGKRVVLQELLYDDVYAEFRRKPDRK
ncbi:MAG: Gfo/Idh/MocA family oxidoreductase [Candidatus Poribacteria bacterium]|nr:Gfo/Idh/MocA family oxidoreductase [Candidatus Poribacteria bacterium]